MSETTASGTGSNEEASLATATAGMSTGPQLALLFGAAGGSGMGERPCVLLIAGRFTGRFDRDSGGAMAGESSPDGGSG